MAADARHANSARATRLVLPAVRAHPQPAPPVTSPRRDTLAINLCGVQPTPESPWGIHLDPVARALPDLGRLWRWADTLRRPKRTLIVDIPIEPDDRTIAHYEGYRVQHSLAGC